MGGGGRGLGAGGRGRGLGFGAAWQARPEAASDYVGLKGMAGRGMGAAGRGMGGNGAGDSLALITCSTICLTLVVANSPLASCSALLEIKCASS
jgi:hypothetical protein